MRNYIEEHHSLQIGLFAKYWCFAKAEQGEAVVAIARHLFSRRSAMFGNYLRKVCFAKAKR